MRFAVINTVTGMAIDIDSRRPVHRQRPGRPVGPGHQADRAAQGARRSTRSPARGAFRSSARAASPAPHDALEFMIAGATAVGIGTALFYDPLVCKAVNRGIAEYLAAQRLGR